MVFIAGLLLAYANGANDNFKGVATLFGSGTARYRGSLVWATVTTLAGSAVALVLANGLLAAFSGKGLVPPGVIASPAFPASVGLAAGGTVLLATRLGFPISTTHALIGGLVGAGLVAAGDLLNLGSLTDKFLVPSLVSPLLAMVLAMTLYPFVRRARRRLGVTHETCICVGQDVVATLPGNPGAAAALQSVSLMLDESANCKVRYQGAVMGISVGRLLDGLHYLSAGAVCFARGLNDTPKIAALLFAGGTIDADMALIAVGVLMAVGGLISARRVAEKMSHDIAEINPGQGLTANLITSSLVIFASKLGVPVSTTHVSCSALFGIGASTHRAHWGVIGQIALAWLITLPTGALLGAGAMAVLGR